MHIYILFAHPTKKSFTFEVLTTFTRGLQEAGHTYEIGDLYRMNFHSILDADQFSRETALKADTPVPDDVWKEQEKVDKAKNKKLTDAKVLAQATRNVREAIAALDFTRAQDLVDKVSKSVQEGTVRLQGELSLAQFVWKALKEGFKNRWDSQYVSQLVPVEEYQKIPARDRKCLVKMGILSVCAGHDDLSRHAAQCIRDAI